MKTRSLLLIVPAVIILSAVGLILGMHPAEAALPSAETHPTLAEFARDIDVRLKPALVHIDRDSAERAAARAHRVHLASR